MFKSTNLFKNFDDEVLLNSIIEKCGIKIKESPNNFLWVR